MPMRWGPGPVFIHESIAATRRLQHYAARSLFVLGLLTALALSWFLPGPTPGFPSQPAGNPTLAMLASLGQTFYLAIATAQLVLVLLAAPAATAGAICQDRARGNLTHMFVTDLSNSEIVLGKLAARLVPVLALVAATVPVLALAGLLGGVILEAILTLTAITLTLAVFGCSLALAISVRAARTHEVLMAVYGIEAAWVLGPLVWDLLATNSQVPPWFVTVNPFVLAWAPYAWPGYVKGTTLAAVLGVVLLLSAGLVVYAVRRLRAEAADRSRPRLSSLSGWLGKTRARLSRWSLAPSLDNNPIHWREWRRGRPSRIARIVWGLYIALALAGTSWGFLEAIDSSNSSREFLAMNNGLQATFGLLLASLAAPTVLAEERVRGSLDVLMTTPVSSARIVLAKWWGAYRYVPALAVLPAIGTIFLAMAAPRFPAAPAPASTPAPLGTLDRIAYASLPIVMLLIQGAVVTSIGLAMATWIRRLGRAVAVSVTVYALAAFGWIVLIELGAATGALRQAGLISVDDHETEMFVAQILATACPLGGQFLVFETVSCSSETARIAFYMGNLAVLLSSLLLALLLLGLVLVTFDRCMGRMPERPRRPPQPPRRVRIPRRPHVLARGEQVSGGTRAGHPLDTITVPPD
jgi:ABC-type transport system involved in multi-copper enzyme maturation permease subunit